MSLSTHFSTAKGISLLFHPHVEVVIHDLKTGLIAAIYNNFSKRKVGDESLLDQIEEFPDVFPAYIKTNWNGKTIKSVSSTLRDSKGKAIGLLCMNLDISKWEELSHFLESFTHIAAKKQPAALFKDDWREKINAYVSTYVAKEKTTLKHLSKEKKKALVLELYSNGAFTAKNAASYIADVLDLSRASVYNYLKGHMHD